MSSGRRGTPNKRPDTRMGAAPAVGLTTGLFVPEAEQRKLEERARRRTTYMFGSFTVIPVPPLTSSPLGTGPANLADNECVHGNLPTDRVVRCGCWGGNGNGAHPPQPSHGSASDPGRDPGGGES